MPPSPRPRLQTAAELAEIRTRVDERHRENQKWQAAMDVKVDDMGKKLDSLLQSRSFTRGVWKAAGAAGGLVGGIVMVLSLVLQWLGSSWWKH